MSIEPEDFVIVRVAEHEARKLAAGCRSLAELIESQHYHSSADAMAVLEHCAGLLDRVAHGASWDGIRCSDAKSIEEIRGDVACGVNEPKHEGLAAVRGFERRDRSIAKIWACDGCWKAIQGLAP